MNLWPYLETCEVEGCIRKTAWHRFNLNDRTQEIYYCYEHSAEVFTEQFDYITWRERL